MGKFDLSDIKKNSKQNIFRKEKETNKIPKLSNKRDKSKSGRPLKKPEERLSKKITVNFTEAEFKTLQKESEKYFNISFFS